MAVDVLICNLTRLGDLLQNQPLINDLHNAGYSVGILCQENFAQALPFLKNISASWTLPGAKILSGLDKSWTHALRDLLNFSRNVQKEAKPRYIINESPDLPARLLCKLIGPDASLLGFGLDEFGYGINEGVWSSFIAVSARKRINAPFNVSDMFRRLAMPIVGKSSGDFLLAPPDEKSIAWAREFIAQYSEKAKGFVAFQPGASSATRRWPIKHFQKLGHALWRKAGLVPVLLGAKSEEGLAKEYGKGISHPWLNAIGKTSLPQVAALLRECTLLVTNDTGTMHLASGQDVPIMAFFLATAQPWDTGPLRPYSCCLEPNLHCHPCSFTKKCSMPECLTSISAESATDLALAFIQTGDWKNGITERVNRECRVWITGRDGDSLSSLTLISNGQKEDRNSWLLVLRYFWRQILDNIEKGVKDEDLSVSLPELSLSKNITDSALPVLSQASSLCESIVTCGEMAQNNPRASQLFLKNCDRLQALLDSSPPLSTQASFWEEFRRNQGTDLDSFLPAVIQFNRACKALEKALSNSKTQ